MKTHREKVIISLIIAVVAFNICFMIYNFRAYDANQKLKSTVENNSNGESIKNEKIIEDMDYKLFFGEWEVSGIIGTHLTLPVDIEIAKKNIGKRITYLRDKISLNGQEERYDPQYSLAIVPVLEPDRSYIEKMPSLKDIGITGEYFVFVSVSTPVNKYAGFLGNEFYIKNDKTLVVIYNDVYYELKRMSYIEGAEIEQIHV